MNSEAQQSYFDYIQGLYSSETIRGYKIALKQFFLFCEKNYDVVKPNDIREWLANMEERGLKPSSIHSKLAVLKSFYIYCREENRITNNPTWSIRLPQKVYSPPYYLTKSEVERLLELTKNDIRERAIVETLYTTGVRIGELVNIKLADVKWETRRILIPRRKGKAERIVYLTEGCAERLKIYLDLRQQDSEFLFSNLQGKMLSRAFVEKRFQAYSKELEFKVMPRTMRHTFAAHLAEKGASQIFILEVLGLCSFSSSHIYTHRKKECYL